MSTKSGQRPLANTSLSHHTEDSIDENTLTEDPRGLNNDCFVVCCVRKVPCVDIIESFSVSQIQKMSELEQSDDLGLIQRRSGK